MPARDPWTGRRSVAATKGGYAVGRPIHLPRSGHGAGSRPGRPSRARAPPPRGRSPTPDRPRAPTRPRSSASETAIAEKSSASAVAAACLAAAGSHSRGGGTLATQPRGVAQLVAHRSPKPGVAGSSPVAPAGRNPRRCGGFGLLGCISQPGRYRSAPAWGAAGETKAQTQFLGPSPPPLDDGQRTFTRTHVLEEAFAVIEVMEFVITWLWALHGASQGPIVRRWSRRPFDTVNVSS